MKGLSVIICCYNSGNKLIATLQYLAKQQKVPGIDYELILVDNNCTDNSIEIATDTWASLNTPYPLNIVLQVIPGLSYARTMGINVSRYGYVVLCDDDNWLSENYLLKMFRLLEAMPAVALVGGVGEAVTDGLVPQWFNDLKGFGYAVGTEGRVTGPVTSVYGAGMGIRKSVFKNIEKGDANFMLSDRKGKNLSSGGDTEICMIISSAGHTIYLDTSLNFKHYLSNARLKWGYYLRLRIAFGKASAYLQLYDDRHSFAVLKKKNSLSKFYSLVKFSILHVKYLLLPFYFKNVHCANAVQQMSLQFTRFWEHKELAALADDINAQKK